jgi:hypothetical protein
MRGVKEEVHETKSRLRLELLAPSKDPASSFGAALKRGIWLMVYTACNHGSGITTFDNKSLGHLLL